MTARPPILCSDALALAITALNDRAADLRAQAAADTGANRVLRLAEATEAENAEAFFCEAKRLYENGIDFAQEVAPCRVS